MDTNAARILAIAFPLRGGGRRLLLAAVTAALVAFVIVALALTALDAGPEPVLLAPLRWQTCRGGACVA